MQLQNSSLSLKETFQLIFLKMPIATHPRGNVNTGSIFHTLKVNQCRSKKKNFSFSFIIMSILNIVAQKLSCYVSLLTFRRKKQKMYHKLFSYSCVSRHSKNYMTTQHVAFRHNTHKYFRLIISFTSCVNISLTQYR